MWLEPDEYPTKYVKDSIGSQRIMLTVIWNPFGFYIIDFLPENESFNSLYFIESILTPLKLKKSQIWTHSNNRKIYLHLDNSKIHNSNISLEKTIEFGIQRAPQPPYSPDIDELQERIDRCNWVFLHDGKWLRKIEFINCRRVIKGYPTLTFQQIIIRIK